MKVLKDEKIMEIKSGKTLIVENGFDSDNNIKPASTFDFLARYTNSAGLTVDGQKVYGNRGFSLIDEGEIWERV